jgi:hypothetical protein
MTAAMERKRLQADADDEPGRQQQQRQAEDRWIDSRKLTPEKLCIHSVVHLVAALDDQAGRLASLLDGANPGVGVAGASALSASAAARRAVAAGSCRAKRAVLPDTHPHMREW